MGPVIQSIAIVFLGCFLMRVDAYPNGQVTEVCNSMVPSHSVSAQTITSPYVLSLDKTTYSPGDKVTVTLTSSSGSTAFRGFLIQARSGSDATPLGSFQVTTSNAQTLTCTTASSAVSQTSGSDKTSLQVTWVAPASTTADIQIRATVVKSTQVFWTNVVSSKLSYMAVPSSTSSSTTSTTTSGGTASTRTSTLGPNVTSNNSTTTTKTTTTSGNQQPSAGSQLCAQNIQLFCVLVAFLFLV